jgi:hypothetical protein
VGHAGQYGLARISRLERGGGRWLFMIPMEYIVGRKDAREEGQMYQNNGKASEQSENLL